MLLEFVVFSKGMKQSREIVQGLCGAHLTTEEGQEALACSSGTGGSVSGGQIWENEMQLPDTVGNKSLNVECHGKRGRERF